MNEQLYKAMIPGLLAGALWYLLFERDDDDALSKLIRSLAVGGAVGAGTHLLHNVDIKGGIDKILRDAQNQVRIQDVAGRIGADAAAGAMVGGTVGAISHPLGRYLLSFHDPRWLRYGASVGDFLRSTQLQTDVYNRILRLPGVQDVLESGLTQRNLQALGDIIRQHTGRFNANELADIEYRTRHSNAIRYLRNQPTRPITEMATQGGLSGALVGSLLSVFAGQAGLL